MHASIVSTSLALLLFAGFTTGPAPAGQAKAAPASGKYMVDPEHSTVLLKVKHLNTSWTFCHFDQVSGEFTVDPAKPESDSLKVVIAASSIASGTTVRDGHLKSADFLDVAQFPEITFTSKKVSKSGEGKYKVEGELSLHGVKKTLTVDLEEVGTSDSKFGVRAGYFGTFSVQRKDFGVTFMPDMVGDEIFVTVSVEGKKPDGSK